MGNSCWWKKNDITREGTQSEALVHSCGMNKLISDPAHIFQNSSSCINLIFLNQPNLVMTVTCILRYVLIVIICILISKLNLNVEYPPIYKRLVWDYKNVDSELKLDSHLSNFFICFNESHLKMMKIAFYFILNALLVLKIFKYISA